MVPVRRVLGQADALQFPVATDEIVAALAPDVSKRAIINGRIQIFKE
jgi:hypothetical protein